MSDVTVKQIAEFCEGVVEGNGDSVLSGANTIEGATTSDLAFADNPKALEAAKQSHAGCLLIPSESLIDVDRTVIRVAKPRLAFSKALAVLYPKKVPVPSLHPTAVIAPSARVGENCSIGAYVSIGERTIIEDRCIIAAGCRIGEGVRVQVDCVLHPNVTLYDNVAIGMRAILHAGCVIGADGFGYQFTGDHYEKFPQVGSVEIGNDVEIGANTCVDRAALGVTRIGDGTKLDNLVHVGHNCTLGKHVVVAAQTGFSGSATVGDYAVIGGQAGVGEKAVIDAKAVVGGKSGVLTGRRIEAGEPVWGIPARPLRQHLRNLAYVAKLPRTQETISELQDRVSALETDKKLGG